MPRAKIDVYWRNLVYARLAINPRASAAAIFRELEEQARKDDRLDFPGDRSISRFCHDFRKLSEDDQRRYGVACWPDSMESEVLEWDASKTTLELQAFLYECIKLPSIRAPVRLARWFWRVTQAAPDAPIFDRVQIALQFSAWELRGRPNRPERDEPELYLAHAPWRSDTARATYLRASKGLGLTGKYPFLADIEPLKDAIPIAYGVGKYHPSGVIIDLNHYLPYLAEHAPPPSQGAAEYAIDSDGESSGEPPDSGPIPAMPSTSENASTPTQPSVVGKRKSHGSQS